MKTFQGTVISTKMAKTAVVEVASAYKHPLYKKIITRTKKFKAHYEEDVKLSEGDKVLIGETRPISKTKHFKVIKLLK